MQKAFQHAIRLLAGRDYSAAALRRKLVEREFSVEDSDAAIARLEEDGWINDLRFAERFAEHAVSSGKFYGIRLRQEMQRRGLPLEIIDQTLQQIAEDHDQTAVLREIIVKRYPDFSFQTSDEKEKRKIIGYLQRRGYGFSSIILVLRESDPSR